jgi:hypothetical protein
MSHRVCVEPCLASPRIASPGLALLLCIVAASTMFVACSDDEPTCPGLTKHYVAEGEAYSPQFFEQDGKLMLMSYGGLGLQWHEVQPDGKLGKRVGHFLWSIIRGGHRTFGDADGRIRLVAAQHVYRISADGLQVEESPLVGDASAIPQGFRLEQVWRVDGELFGIWSH